jgi:hypothetical protein
VTVSFIGGGNRVPRENHQPVESHLQTLSHDESSSHWNVTSTCYDMAEKFFTWVKQQSLTQSISSLDILFNEPPKLLTIAPYKNNPL